MMEEQDRMYGLYKGVVTAVRYHKGMHFVQCKLLGWTVPDPDLVEHPWYTVWAPVICPGVGALLPGQDRYGFWRAPHVEDVAMIAFEEGHQGHPHCVGFLPHEDDMPPEFDNDDYRVKEREHQDRQNPTTEAAPDPVNEAAMLATVLSYILLHDKTGRLVLSVCKDGHIELGEGPSLEPAGLGGCGEDDSGYEKDGNKGMRLCLEILARDFFCHTHPSTARPNNLSVDEWEEYISLYSWAYHANPSEVESNLSEPSEPFDLAQFTSELSNLAGKLCDMVTQADSFLEDPVGSVTEGIGSALDNYTGTSLQGVDLNAVKEDVNGFLDDLGGKITAAGKGALTDSLDAAGPLGGLLGSDAAGAIAGQVGGLDLGGVTSLAKNAFGKVTELANSAGVGAVLDNLPSEALGGALDGLASNVKGKVGDLVGEAVGGLGLDMPLVDGALDLASGLCSGNMADTIGGLFSLAVDGLNTLSGGLLTPFTGTIKTVGANLINGAFQGGDDPSNVELIDQARAE